MELSRLAFYKVDENYAKYLQDNFDSRVPNIKSADYKHDKFFIGVIVTINKMNYFAPVSSYKGVNKTTFNIRDKDETVMSSVRLNYMFPVVNSVFSLLKFDDFDAKYKNFVQKELEYCNVHRSTIYDMATIIYRKKTTGKYNNENERSIFDLICCDFKKLEVGAKAYTHKK